MGTRRSSLGADKAADLRKKIEAHRGEKSRSRAQSETALRAKRAKEMVAPSLHQLGIVVPVDTKTNTGYRELPTTGQDLADLLHQLEQDADKKLPTRKRLSELITRATIASDECDFGTGLLLGLNVFTAGSCLEVRHKWRFVFKDKLWTHIFVRAIAEGGTAATSRRVHAAAPRQLYKVASGHCKHRDHDDTNASINSIVDSSSESSGKQPKATTVELPASLLQSRS